MAEPPPQPAIPRGCNAYIDESMRDDDYLVACVLVRANDVAAVRSALRSRLRTAQQRLHFTSEQPNVALRHLLAIAEMPVISVVASRAWTLDRSPAVTRQMLLTAVLDHVLPSGVGDLVLDRWQGARLVDDPVLRAARRRHPQSAHMRFDHMPSRDHEILWAADGVAWAVGRGGKWAAAVGPVVHLSVPEP